MPVTINEESLKQGLLGLLVALIEIIADALKIEAFKRVDKGHLSEEEIERLGQAIWDLEVALEKIKKDNEIENAVKQVRHGLDQLVEDVLDRMVNPERWVEDLQGGA
ncbi:MAG: gas vesicle protein GvpK [Bacillota bacterium]|nr:gas vesicle protein GvpK [Bacillota bacterium]